MMIIDNIYADVEEIVSGGSGIEADNTIEVEDSIMSVLKERK